MHGPGRFAAALLVLVVATSAVGQGFRPPMTHPNVEPRPDHIAFVDVNVVSMDGERVLSHQTVLVKDRRIAAVGPVGDIKVPVDASIIDGAGRYLMPGLADMHVHTWDTNDFILFLANGVTSVRNMWGRTVHLTWREQVESGGRLAPTVYTTGPIVDGVPPVWPGSIGVDDPEDARRIVRKQHADGYDAIKVYSRLQPDVFAAIVETAEELDMSVVGHVPNAVGLEPALAAGQDCIEHLTGYLDAGQSEDSPARTAAPGEARQLTATHFDPQRIPALVEATIEAGAWNCPTFVVLERWVPPDEMEAFLAAPEMRYVSPNVKAFWNPRNDFRRRSMTDEQYDSVRKGNVHRRVIARALHEAGAGILLGTDTPNPLVVPGFSIHEELRFLVDAGLSPYDAIAAGTREAAVFLGEEDEFGRVRVGLRADLILLESNPLDDVANVRERVGVMVRGRWLAESSLQRMLETLAKSYERGGHE